MRVFITGGSGMIGRRLAGALERQGHEPVILSRQADVLRRDAAMRPYQIVAGDPTAPGAWREAVDGCDAVVNLAGQNIFARRWNADVKRAIRDSRVYGAQHLVVAMRLCRNPPKVFVQGSAVGYYGITGDQELTEASPSGTDFLAVTCRETEEVSADLLSSGVRRVLLRTGIVLAHGEGALRLMTPIFKLGPGAPIGSGSGFVARGSQWMSWIHMDDLVGIIQLALANDGPAGPMNATAPNPVTNAEFARTFSAVLRTKYTPWRFYLPIGPPDALLQLVLGEVASVITTGQRVLPAKAQALGYSFKYPGIAEALRAIFPQNASRRARQPAQHDPARAAAHH
jgi:uncharacterized protein (TIGR01777 family)